MAPPTALACPRQAASSREPVGRRAHDGDREADDVARGSVDAVPPELRHEGAVPLTDDQLRPLRLRLERGEASLDGAGSAVRRDDDGDGYRIS